MSSKSNPFTLSPQAITARSPGTPTWMSAGRSQAQWLLQKLLLRQNSVRSKPSFFLLQCACNFVVSMIIDYGMMMTNPSTLLALRLGCMWLLWSMGALLHLSKPIPYPRGKARQLILGHFYSNQSGGSKYEVVGRTHKEGCLERDILQLAGSDSLIWSLLLLYSTVVSNDY